MEQQPLFNAAVSGDPLVNENASGVKNEQDTVMGDALEVCYTILY